MVARITTPGSIRQSLNYNEQKVKSEQAVLLHAEGFLKDTEQLNFTDKLMRFKGLIELNDRAKTNTLHISLNFDNADKIDREKLVDIATEYMQKIGFKEQPYLVYQHYDAGHPHAHIVTTNIRVDGSRIDTFNIGRNQSEKARKEIQIAYDLVRADNMKTKQDVLKPAYVKKIQYGRSETKKAITNVLNEVLNTYKYSSLPELNAVLKQYNVLADRGGENSRIFKNNGLVYRILDENGNKIGVPIKASDFYSKPTLKFLEVKFQQNEVEKQSKKSWVRTAIDLALLKNPNHSVNSLIKALEKEGIKTVLRQNDQGLMYGITYVDYRTQCVYNGSDLGKQYSAKAIQERCGKSVAGEEKNTPSVTLQHSLGSNTVSEQVASPSQPQAEPSSLLQGAGKVLEILMRPEHTPNYVPGQLKGKKKKKRLGNRL